MVEENTNQEENHSPIDYAKAYQQGFVAARLSSDEESAMYIPGALAVLGKDLKVSGPATIYQKVMESTPQAKQKLIEIATNDYNVEKKKIKIGDLFDWYAESISHEAPEELRGKNKNLFGAYLDKTIEDIEKEIGDYNYILNPRTNASDEDKTAAKKAIEERKDILGKISIFESYSLEKGRQRAVDATIKPNLESLVK